MAQNKNISRSMTSDDTSNKNLTNYVRFGACVDFYCFIPNNDNKNVSLYCSLCNEFLRTIDMYFEHVNLDVHCANRKSICNKGNCKIKKSSKWNKMQILYNLLADSKWEINDTDVYTCASCQKKVPITHLYKHVSIGSDKSAYTCPAKCNLHKYVYFFCKACKLILQGASALKNHLLLEKHLTNINEIIVKKLSNATIEHIFKICKKKFIYFPLCSYILPQPHEFKKYMDYSFLFYVVYNKDEDMEETINYVCFYCSEIFSTSELNQHFESEKHRQIENIKNTQLQQHNAEQDSNKNEVVMPNNIRFEMMNQLNNSKNTIMDSTNEAKFPKRRNFYEYMPEYILLEETIFFEVEEKLNKIISSIQFIENDNKVIYCLSCETQLNSDTTKYIDHILTPAHIDNCNIIDMRDLSKYLQILRREAYCLCCCKSIPNKNVVKHISLSSHCEKIEKIRNSCYNESCAIKQQFQSVWYSVDNFSCLLCKIEYSGKHSFIKHVFKNHQILSKDFLFEFCLICAWLWLGPNGSYKEHCKLLMHKRLLQNKDLIIPSLPKDKIKLLKEADRFAEYCISKSNEAMKKNDNIEELIACLIQTLKPTYPDIAIYKFGSRESGLAFSNSDGDIFIDFGNSYFNKDSISDKLPILLMKLEEFFNNCKLPWILLEIITKTRVPIVKVIHLSTNLTCDISMGNALAVENTNLLRYYMVSYPLCRKLALFLKKFWGNYFIHDPITSYAHTWLVIFYLQDKMNLPSVADLRSEPYVSRLVNGWETAFIEKTPVSQLQANFIDLLCGFFEYYGQFDYKNMIVCPLLGKLITKKAMTKHEEMPNEMEYYSSCGEQLVLDSPLCVQDPFELSHNLTKSIKPRTIKMFKLHCIECATRLCNRNN